MKPVLIAVLLAATVVPSWAGAPKPVPKPEGFDAEVAWLTEKRATLRDLYPYPNPNPYAGENCLPDGVEFGNKVWKAKGRLNETARGDDLVFLALDQCQVVTGGRVPFEIEDASMVGQADQVVQMRPPVAALIQPPGEDDFPPGPPPMVAAPGTGAQMVPATENELGPEGVLLLPNPPGHEAPPASAFNDGPGVRYVPKSIVSPDDLFVLREGKGNWKQ